LLSDLDKETSHTIVRVVVTSDGVDHLDAVHQGRKSILDGLWGSVIKRLYELLKSGKVLDIVLCLIKGLSYPQLNASPFGGSKVDFIAGFAKLLGGILGSLSEYIIDSAAVLAAELLRDAS